MTQDLAKNLNEINKELSAEHKKRGDEKAKAVEANNLLNPDDRKRERKEKLEKENQDVSHKTRSTIKVYREIKSFLQGLLLKVAPPEIEGMFIFS